jgi:hypothetical protein
MSGSLMRFRRFPTGGARRARLVQYSTLAGRQRQQSFGLTRVKAVDIPPTTNWWNNWMGGGGGSSGGVKSVYIGEVPDPHVDTDCLRDIIEGYATVHYYNAAYNSITNGEPSHNAEVTWQVNNEKLPGMTGGSPCTQFGRDLANFGINNWDTICEMLEEGFDNGRLFKLISIFKGEKHQLTAEPSQTAQDMSRE